LASSKSHTACPPSGEEKRFQFVGEIGINYKGSTCGPSE